jgi:hypothetical protein
MGKHSQALEAAQTAIPLAPSLLSFNFYVL